MRTKDEENNNDKSVDQPEPVYFWVKNMSEIEEKFRTAKLCAKRDQPGAHRYMSHLRAHGMSESTQLTL